MECIGSEGDVRSVRLDGDHCQPISDNTLSVEKSRIQVGQGHIPDVSIQAILGDEDAAGSGEQLGVLDSDGVDRVLFPIRPADSIVDFGGDDMGAHFIRSNSQEKS